MELTKKNIHMESTKCTAATQVMVEEDVIVPDYNPDVEKVIYEKGHLQVEEIKATADRLLVKGTISVDVLYQAESGTHKMAKMSNSIPFEESIYMEGLENGDRVWLHRELEHLTIGMINPRKLSIEALLSFAASVEELKDLEASVTCMTQEQVVCKHQLVQTTELIMQKKDIFRMKEECELPKSYPNIQNLLWNQTTVSGIEFTPYDDKVVVKGEVKLFLLYEGTGEDATIRFYETMLPFNGSIECGGCSETMVLDVDYQLDHGELEIKPDFDGEDRALGVDIALELFLNLYEEGSYELLEDMYAMKQEVTLTKEAVNVKNLLAHTTGRCKIVERIKVKQSIPKMMELCNSDAQVELVEVVVVEEGIELNGQVKLKVLAETNELLQPYQSMMEVIPFSYLMEAKGIKETSDIKVKGVVDQVHVSMMDGEELEAKLILSFEAIIWKEQMIHNVTEVVSGPIDRTRLEELPSMVVYVAKEGDTLWDVGKRYYTSIDQLKEMNQINGELTAGDKILVVKSMANQI